MFGSVSTLDKPFPQKPDERWLLYLKHPAGFSLNQTLDNSLRVTARHIIY
jgi:hypothetical protein